jgi:predicted deacylase
MMKGIQIGSATGQPGKIVTGWLDGVGLPTGGVDRFPVIVAQGREDGPVFWVTASIHGGEHTGLIAAQRLAIPELVRGLKGTLVVIPTLNPAGLRTKERTAYYHNGDPNRLFPEPRPRRSVEDEPQEMSGLEHAYRRVYETIEASGASYLLDLHNAQIGSLPMAFRDPVFYHRRPGAGLLRSQAQALQERVGEMLDAFGFTIVNEFVSDSYVDRQLDRSVSGAVLNGLGIPAATIELGSWLHVDEHVVEACLVGLRNALRWAGLLAGDPEPLTGIPIIHSDQPMRRHLAPYAPQSGIVHHLVRPGERIEQGQPLARMTDIFGAPLGKEGGLLRSEYDGFVLAWQHGVVRYEGEAVMVLAIPDEGQIVVPYPR